MLEKWIKTRTPSEVARYERPGRSKNPRSEVKEAWNLLKRLEDEREEALTEGEEATHADDWWTEPEVEDSDEEMNEGEETGNGEGVEADMEEGEGTDNEDDDDHDRDETENEHEDEEEDHEDGDKWDDNGVELPEEAQDQHHGSLLQAMVGEVDLPIRERGQPMFQRATPRQRLAFRVQKRNP